MGTLSFQYAKQISQPIEVGAGTIITLTGYGYVEWIAGSMSNAKSSDVSWQTWPAGQSAGRMETGARIVFRIVSTGACTAVWEERSEDEGKNLTPWVPDVGVGLGYQPYVVNASGQDVALGTVLAKSAVPVSLTGTTTATPMLEVMVPGGSMGPNGSARITVYYSMTNNANNKRLMIRWGGVRAEVFNLNISSWAAASAMVEVSNRGATGSQIANAGGTTASFGQLPAFVLTSENTLVDQPIQFVGTLANASDTLTIERYTVELLK